MRGKDTTSDCIYSYHSYKRIVISIPIVEESLENQIDNRTDGTANSTPSQRQRHHSIGHENDE